MAQPDTVSLNKNDKTLLHTQASDRTPRESGAVFLWASISMACVPGPVRRRPAELPSTYPRPVRPVPRVRPECQRGRRDLAAATHQIPAEVHGTVRGFVCGPPRTEWVTDDDHGRGIRWRWSMLTQPLETVGRFRKRRAVTRRYLPQHTIGLGRESKPLSTTLPCSRHERGDADNCAERRDQQTCWL